VTLPWTHLGSVVLASFMASLVECVEALTVVLAVGVIRGWRHALTGTAAALTVLLLIVLVLRDSLAAAPLALVRLAIGTLLLLFGFRWLRKAILRSAGILRLHDEADEYARQTRALREAGDAATAAWDPIAFATAFKIVMLEGLEVVFIVVAIGANGESLGAAIAGALAALVAVALLGATLHRPLAKIPENSLKFAVAVLLAAFGSFWVGEGWGFSWPGADASLAILIAAYVLVAGALAAICRRAAAPERGPAASQSPAAAADAEPARNGASWRGSRAVRNAVRGALHAGLHLFVDDGYLALGLVVWILAARFIPAALADHPALQGAVFALGLIALLARSAIHAARPAKR
jgi:uncharacterized membrane protein